MNALTGIALVAVSLGAMTALASCAPAQAPAQVVTPGGEDPTVQPAQVTPQQVTPPGAPPGTIQPTTDIEIRFADDSLQFVASIPDGNDPTIAGIRRETESHLAEMKKDARAAFDEAKKDGGSSSKWDVDINWAYTARAGNIISLFGSSSEYTGGAHPVHYFLTRIARAGTGEQLQFANMFMAARWPSPALTIGVCEALKAEKIKRINEATISMEPLACVGPAANLNMEAAKFGLAPSNTPDRFGGVYVYFQPYDVGAYAEGGYELTVQQEVFREDLKPEFKALFAGEAPRIEN